MSLTNPKDFSKLWSLIPWNKRENVWLLPIRQNQKLPEIKAGDKWKLNEKYKLLYDEALTRMRWGSNVAIVAITEGLMFLDLDVKDKKFCASNAFLDALELKYKDTFKVKSRNGGIQYYFWNDGKYANQLLKENDIIIGELRTNWQYVVAVGSHVEPDGHNLNGDGIYRIIAENSIQPFDGIPGLNLKLMGESPAIQEHNIKIDEHERPENQISESQHLRDLLGMGAKRLKPWRGNK